ncbi:MAG TPA: hypothetical protein EYG57_14860 [Planctomycetes bacterium]|nr:hypothetical protein [Planctomycetota bacterium]
MPLPVAPEASSLAGKFVSHITKAWVTTVNVLLRDNPDAAYYGKNAGPLDKAKVLLRWKLTDGRYHSGGTPILPVPHIDWSLLAEPVARMV